MVELTSSIISEIFAIIGGLIAGVVGVIASLVSSRYGDMLARRKEHLQKHKENLEIIERVCKDVLGNVYPPLRPGGYEGFGTPWEGRFGLPDEIERGKIVDTELKGISEFDIKEYVLIYSREDGETVQTRVNRILMDDLRSHFPQLSKTIADYESLIKNAGETLLNNFYLYSDSIYDELEKAGYTSRYTRDQTALQLSPSQGHLFLEGAARIVFNKSLEVEPSYWRSTYRYYTSIPEEKDKLNAISEIFSKKEIAENIRKGLEEIEKGIEDVTQKIDKVIQITKLPGKCNYL